MVVLALIIAILTLHSTPNLAVRTYVFVSGNPIIAMTTDIMDYNNYSTGEKESYEQMNAKIYTLTNPPIEKATQGMLENYLVKRYGFFHYVEFYGH